MNPKSGDIVRVLDGRGCETNWIGMCYRFDSYYGFWEILLPIGLFRVRRDRIIII